MNYSKEDYKRDLQDPNAPHVQNREHFKNFYDQLGADDPAQNVQYPAHRMSFVNPTQGGLILELGCHAGYDIVKWLSDDQNALAVGVDISTPLIEEARRRTEAAGVADRAMFIESFIEDLPVSDHIVKTHTEPSILPKAFFTDVVLTETLEHVQDPKAVLEATRLLMGAGTTLWISVPATRWGNFSHLRGITAKQLQELLFDTGFIYEDIDWIEQRGGDTYAKITTGTRV